MFTLFYICVIDISNLNNIPGIYCIENLSSKKIYIGSSKDIRVRVESGHFRSLRLNEHVNRHLQNSFNKYGEDSFIAFVLEECPLEKLIEREQFYIDFFLYSQEYIKSNGSDNRFIKYGMNLSPTASSTLGCVHTEDQKKANSERAKQLWQDTDFIAKQNEIRTEEWHKNRVEKMIESKEKDSTYKERLKESMKNSPKRNAVKKPILVYNRITGEFIKEYESGREVSRQLKLDHSRIIKVLGGKVKYTNDMVFKHKESDNYPLNIEPVPQYTSEESRAEGLKKTRDKNSIPILAYRLNGQPLGEYKNANEAALKLGIGIENAGGIRRMLRGQTQQCKGYKFKYKDPNHKPKVYNKSKV